MKFSDLPGEVLIKTIKYLSPSDIAQCHTVCRRLECTTFEVLYQHIVFGKHCPSVIEAFMNLLTTYPERCNSVKSITLLNSNKKMLFSILKFFQENCLHVTNVTVDPSLSLDSSFWDMMLETQWKLEDLTIYQNKSNASMVINRINTEYYHEYSMVQENHKKTINTIWFSMNDALDELETNPYILLQKVKEYLANRIREFTNANNLSLVDIITSDFFVFDTLFSEDLKSLELVANDETDSVSFEENGTELLENLQAIMPCLNLKYLLLKSTSLSEFVIRYKMYKFPNLKTFIFEEKEEGEVFCVSEKTLKEYANYLANMIKYSIEITYLKNHQVETLMRNNTMSNNHLSLIIDKYLEEYEYEPDFKEENAIQYVKIEKDTNNGIKSYKTEAVITGEVSRLLKKPLMFFDVHLTELVIACRDKSSATTVALGLILDTCPQLKGLKISDNITISLVNMNVEKPSTVMETLDFGDALGIEDERYEIKTKSTMDKTELYLKISKVTPRLKALHTPMDPCSILNLSGIISFFSDVQFLKVCCSLLYTPMATKNEPKNCLKTLILDNCRFEPTFFLDLYGYCPNLETLQSLSTKRLYTTRALTIKINLPSIINSFPKLKYLALYGVKILLDSTIEITKSGSLETLILGKCKVNLNEAPQFFTDYLQSLEEFKFTPNF